jgi:hypothetical protein
MLSELTVRYGSYRSQGRTQFVHGYARVTYLHQYGRVLLQKEGEEKDTECPLSEDCTEAFRLCTETLSTGRTVLCGKGVTLPEVPHYYGSSPVHTPMESLVACLEGWRGHLPWNLNPPYQRESVWTPEHQSRFLGHVLEGGLVPPLYVQRYESQRNVPRGTKYENLPEEVLDGKQRCLAWWAFHRGEVGATLSDGTVLYYKDFNEVDRRDHRLELKVVYLDLSYEDRLKFYLRLNSAGIPHTPAELRKVEDLLRSAQTT